MAIKVASASGTWTKDVYTDRGLYCGKVEDIECDLNRFKVRSLIVKAVKNSYLSEMVGNKKGLIIPFTMVEAIGDVIIIKHISTPIGEEPLASEELQRRYNEDFE